MPKKVILTIEEVKHIAKLANLDLPRESIEIFQKQLTRILDMVNKIQEVDTQNVIPTSQVTGLENVFREDNVLSSLTQEEALSNAPRKYNGYFVVDAVLEE